MTRAAEQTHVDPSNRRIVNANLAEYHVSVNADIGSIEVSAIDIPDTKIDLLGARGIGEIGITGTGPRLPMRFITPPANGFAICRSLRTN
jgi:CO/xanthine dehydrogenase Mo-binding subunit